LSWLYDVTSETAGGSSSSFWQRYCGGDYPNEPITRFDCNGAGENETIRVEVSDDEFQHCSDAWTVEVSCLSLLKTPSTAQSLTFPHSGSS
jgi:hypothetical protein